jgi:uncharacterized membrane protein YccF (DUF307 family)
MGQTQVVEVKTGPPILVRIVWYLLVGWRVTGIAMAIAWLAAIVIVGLPLSFWLVNRIPTMLTLPRRVTPRASATNAADDRKSAVTTDPRRQRWLPGSPG